MTIEYKIEFHKSGVTVAQTIIGGPGDLGGNGLRPADPGSGSGDLGGNGLPPADPGGGGGRQVRAIVFGPTIVFSGGAVQAANKEERMPQQTVIFAPPKPE